MSLRTHFRLSERTAHDSRILRGKDTKSETKTPDNPKSTNRIRHIGTPPGAGMPDDPHAGAVRGESSTSRCTNVSDGLGGPADCPRPGSSTRTKTSDNPPARKPVRESSTRRHARTSANPAACRTGRHAGTTLVPFPMSLRARFRLSEVMAPDSRILRGKDTESETKIPDDPKSESRVRQSDTPRCRNDCGSGTLPHRQRFPHHHRLTYHRELLDAGNPRHRQTTMGQGTHANAPTRMRPCESECRPNPKLSESLHAQLGELAGV